MSLTFPEQFLLGSSAEYILKVKKAFILRHVSTGHGSYRVAFLLRVSHGRRWRRISQLHSETSKFDFYLNPEFIYREEKGPLRCFEKPLGYLSRLRAWYLPEAKCGWLDLILCTSARGLTCQTWILQVHCNYSREGQPYLNVVLLVSILWPLWEDSADKEDLGFIGPSPSWPNGQLYQYGTSVVICEISSLDLVYFRCFSKGYISLIESAGPSR